MRAGTVRCNGGLCQNALSDLNNCGAYVNVVNAFLIPRVRLNF
jgi:hypothetical protein